MTTFIIPKISPTEFDNDFCHKMYVSIDDSYTKCELSLIYNYVYLNQKNPTMKNPLNVINLLTLKKDEFVLLNNAETPTIIKQKQIEKRVILRYDVDCSICHEKIKNDLYVFPCCPKMPYHDKCAYVWCKPHRTIDGDGIFECKNGCPICKTTITLHGHEEGEGEESDEDED